MSKLREAEEELFRAWRGSSLPEMIAAVHAMDDALADDRLTAAVLAEREACAAFLDEYAKQYQSIAERQALEGNWNLSAITHSEKCLVEFLANKMREREEKKCI